MLFVLGKPKQSVGLLSQRLQNINGSTETDHIAAHFFMFQSLDRLKYISWVRVCQGCKNTKYLLTHVVWHGFEVI